MDYVACIQRSIDYIEEHLDRRITLNELAEIACFSPFHFHRVFHVMVGEPVMDYVRKRRLSAAAVRLLATDDKVIDIAFDVGFHYHESFNRAFKKCFGVSPKQLRQRGSVLGSLRERACLSTYIMTGGISVEPKFFTKPAFSIMGYELRTSNTDGQNNRDIPAFWQDYIVNRKGAAIPNPIDSSTEFGMCVDNDPETSEFTYLIGMEVAEGSTAPEGMTYRRFPEAEYAVFTTPKASESEFVPSIQNTWNYIFTKWFQNSGYEHSGSVEFELYDTRCHGSENKQIDIYLPVKKTAVPSTK
ncbi:AraC family transcriptional regulator [Fictibacillus aquaticus]|uniref:AraC family transcriptional regulator n=1 Tax=Fictibacillus aquaticus TaxID=2021314 RepID=A0A235F7C0_9BACL|nr:AraC family transcriptional regulator [Fictibacillus aquaticus]OYD56585.1 AraC family transcriptional regulator [Fictibacillus aquaticus]